MQEIMQNALTIRRASIRSVRLTRIGTAAT